MKIRRNQIVYMIGDILSSIAAVLLTFGLRSDWNAFFYLPFDFILWICVYCSLFTVVAGLTLGSYNSIWVYIGFSEMFLQTLIVTLQAIAAFVLKFFFIPRLTYSDIILYWGVLLFFTCGIRCYSRCRRWFLAKLDAQNGHARKAIIVGAGAAGAMIIKRLRSNSTDGIYPVAVLDDDDSKLGIRVSGIPVCGKVKDAKDVARKFNAEEIIIAIPSASPGELRTIYGHCIEAQIPIKVFRSVIDWNSLEYIKKIPLAEVPIEELLCRDVVKTDEEKIFKYINGKTVLVTGGAGSIGSELCRQVLRYGCSRLIAFDISENSLFKLNEELKNTWSKERYEICIGSIQDEPRLNQIFESYKPDIVFHAAAHKHVPMMEANPIEAVKNNVFGTRNVIRCCIKHKAGRFILISTDKAVRPTSIMGATKRIAELQVQSMNEPGCELAAVRFGNVLGSSGSVVPIFREQIARGGPVTVTHKDIERFFMTIPEAVSLVLCAGSLAKGGEIFVLDMGSPVKIYDLACHMIRLAGLEPEKDIPIQITGLRPGEKLYEELSLDCETVRHTGSDKILIMKNDKPVASDLKLNLKRLQNLVEMCAPDDAVRNAVFDIVAGNRISLTEKNRSEKNVVAAV